MTFWNGRAEELFGWPREQALGRPLVELAAPPEVAADLAELLGALPGGARWDGDLHLRRRDGVPWEAHVSLTSLRGATSAAAAVLVATDITERSLAERRLDDLRQLAARLAGSSTADEVLDVLAAETRRVLAVEGIWVGLLDGTRSELRAVRHVGYAPETVRRYAIVALEASTPVGDAVHERRALWFDSTEAFLARYPALQPAGTGLGAFGCLPLLSHGEAFGCVVLQLPAAGRIAAETRELMGSIVDQCAVALERARLHDAEADARRRAEQLADRLSRVQAVTDAALTHLTLDELVPEVLARVREALRADTATLLLLDERPGVLRIREELGLGDEVRRAEIPLGKGFGGRIAAERRPLLLPDTEGFPFHTGLLARAGVRSLAGVPLLAGSRTLGVVHVGSFHRAAFDEDDVRLLQLVSDRMALALENARLYEQEREIAETLQRGILPPELPSIAGVTIAAQYVPAGPGLEVGGDWYDVLELADGRVALVIGDVVGHGLEAAAAMGQLRNAARAHLLQGEGPAGVLDALNRLVHAGGVGRMATVLCAVLDPAAARLRYAAAGHPPPLAVPPAGAPDLLDGATAPPLGAIRDARYVEAERPFDRGAALLLYTDGLVERRDRGLDEGIAELVATVAELGAQRPAALVEALSATLAERGDDDAALLVLRLEQLAQPTLQLEVPAEPEALAPLRRALARFLEQAGLPPPEVFEITVAASEAAANAVEHAYGPADATFSLETSLDGPEVTVVVRDRGSWRERSASGRGRGLQLVQALMDTVELVREDGGTEVRMRRRRREG